MLSGLTLPLSDIFAAAALVVAGFAAIWAAKRVIELFMMEFSDDWERMSDEEYESVKNGTWKQSDWD